MLLFFVILSLVVRTMQLIGCKETAPEWHMCRVGR